MRNLPKIFVRSFKNVGPAGTLLSVARCSTTWHMSAFGAAHWTSTG